MNASSASTTVRTSRGRGGAALHGNAARNMSQHAHVQQTLELVRIRLGMSNEYMHALSDHCSKKPAIDTCHIRGMPPAARAGVLQRKHGRGSIQLALIPEHRKSKHQAHQDCSCMRKLQSAGVFTCYPKALASARKQASPTTCEDGAREEFATTAHKWPHTENMDDWLQKVL